MVSTPVNLPCGLMLLGDPVEGNPFAQGTPRDQEWMRANRIAKKRLARFNSEILSEITPCIP